MTPENLVLLFKYADRVIYLLEFLIGLLLVFICFYIIKFIYTWVVGLFVNYL